MRLPPLNALRAFEAAARHGSFVRAGQELNVSPGAISRHVKLLEAHLGCLLFERQAQGLKPTEAARRLLPKISEAFTLIAAAAADLPGQSRQLKVIASPTFANRLLVPRLPEFARQQPSVTVSLSVLLADLGETHLAASDCGIATFHAPVWPSGVKAVKVRAEELTPLSAPALLEAQGGAMTPNDLASQTLLHVDACTADWPNWLARNGLTGRVDLSRGPHYETGELAIRAAVQGLGIIVMDRFLVAQELANGSLVDLFPEHEPVDNGYFFFSAARRWNEPAIAAFRDWALVAFADTAAR